MNKTIRYPPGWTCAARPYGNLSQASGYAEVSIFNQLGVEVARLFSGELDAGEQHTFTWNNPSALPDDVYECLIRMNGQVEKLPMVLLK